MKDMENKAENAEQKAVRDFELLVTKHADLEYLKSVFMDMIVGYSRYVQHDDALFIGGPDDHIYYLYRMVQILDGRYADQYSQTE